MKKALSLLMAFAVTLSVTSGSAHDTRPCASSSCKTARKSWNTVKNGTENAVHVTGEWGHKTGNTVGRWGADTGRNIGKWGKKTGQKIGAWGSDAAKDTRIFLTGH